MFVRVGRTALVPLWIVAFGLAALMWSPMTVVTGALLLLVAIAGPVALAFWRGR